MIPLLVILAQARAPDRYEALRDAFKPSEADGWQQLTHALTVCLVIAASFALIFLLASALRSRSERADGRLAAALYRRALFGLGLVWPDRVLLRCVARHAGLRPPCVLLFSPGLLERCANAWIAGLPTSMLRRFVAARLALISRRLFAEQPPESADPAFSPPSTGS